MKSILAKLFEHQTLDRNTSKEVLSKISDGAYNDAQVAAFITVYMVRDITVEELLGFRDALLELSLSTGLEGFNATDLCGTGGDGKNTFNISTAASLVVAAAGYPVVKHGNYGVSSTCGSSNVLEHIGYQFTNNQDELRSQLERYNICFLHAPLFHPAMKAVAPIRRSLKMKTFFNMLGPLVNPARPKNQFVGVFSKQLSRVYQYILQETDQNFAIVHSLDGYDEVSLTSQFSLKMNSGERLLSPSDIGQTDCDPSDLFGGETIPEAADIFCKVLNNQGTQAQMAAVIANAGLAIHCQKPKESIQDCIAEAREGLNSGKAIKILKSLTNN